MPEPATQLHDDLAKVSLPLLVLAVLADGPRYGYALQRRVHAQAGAAVPWSRLYPLLHDLEAQGLILASWEATTGRRRKWYTLTEPGHARFRREAAAWSASLARLQAVVLPAVRRSASLRSPSTEPRP